MKVCEIFSSIQGESTWAGLPCLFIRLSGCNLDCIYCDTRYAKVEAIEMSEAEVLSKAYSSGLDLVGITGGEPLLQPESISLAEALYKAGKTGLVETNGSMRIDTLPEGVIRIMDFKCPGSGETEKMDWNNLDRLNLKDEVKFVICNRTDFDWAVELEKNHNLTEKCHAVLFSPAYNLLEPKQLAEWIILEKLNVRMQLQIHKYIWHPDQRRV